MRSLVDVNVWLSLLVRKHQHHRIARKWYDGLEASEAGLCRFVQLGLIRLLGNRSVMQEDAVSAATAWNLIEELLEDERVEFVSEPPDLDSFFPALLNYPIPTSKLVSDSYLSAFAWLLSTPDIGNFEGWSLSYWGAGVRSRSAIGGWSCHAGKGAKMRVIVDSVAGRGPSKEGNSGE